LADVHGWALQIYEDMNQDYRNESFGMAGDANREQLETIRDKLTEAVIKCSERCLYQSAKW